MSITITVPLSRAVAHNMTVVAKSASTTVPILRHVTVISTGQEVTISSTDRYALAWHTVEAEEGPGELLVPVEVFQQLVRQLPARADRTSPVTFDWDPEAGTGRMTVGVISTEFTAPDPEAYPKVGRLIDGAREAREYAGGTFAWGVPAWASLAKFKAGKDDFMTLGVTEKNGVANIVLGKFGDTRFLSMPVRNQGDLWSQLREPVVGVTR